jgi:hypothetical protein
MNRLQACPECEAVIGEYIEGEALGEHVLYSRCEECRTVYYPGWREQCWEDPDTRPIPKQLVSYMDDDTALLARVSRQAALVLHPMRALMTTVAALGVIAIVSVIATSHFRCLAASS